MIGKTLAHYEISDLLGRGGMGEVYRARDRKLDREVALKVLPPEMAGDPERLARLQREAKLLAALNHSNIASIHGIEEAEGKVILVMELAQGAELTSRITAGLPLEQALEIARQICEGLEEAHAKGIVHRDLKPANIMVSPEGRVKILDFGLARAFENDSAPQADSTHSPTITAMHTMAGSILGTAAYMSPEQARGLTVDKRADIFTFGTILFEMLTGRQLFDGATISDKLAAILKSEPDWSLLSSETPPRLRELLERCLAKKRRQRMQDIGDVRIEIEKLQAGDDGVFVTRQRGGLPLGPSLAGAVLLAAVVGFAAWNLSPKPGREPVEMTAPQHLGVHFPDEISAGNFVVGPGEVLYVAARPANPATPEDNVTSIYFKRPDRPGFTPLPGTRSLRNGAFSPDGHWLAVIAPDQSAAETLQLWKIATDLSEPPQRIRTWPGTWDTRYIHWMPDGDLVVHAVLGKLHRIPMDGRPEPEPIDLQLPSGSINFGPDEGLERLLPGGTHLLTTAETWDEEGYSNDIWTIDTSTGESSLVLKNGHAPSWLDTGHLLFSRGNSILAVAFDPQSLQVSGGMVAVADGLRTESAWAHGAYSLSPAGDLYFKPGGLVGQKQILAFTDRNFRDFTAWSDDTYALEQRPIVSPDGRYLATIFARPGGTYETWISRLDRPGFRLFASQQDGDISPAIWTPDSREIILVSFTSDINAILTRKVEGGEDDRILFQKPSNNTFIVPSAMADEGRTLILTWVEGGASSIRTLPFDTPGDIEPTPILTEARDATMSPDGRWVAYISTTGGRHLLQVRRWLGNGQLGPPYHVTPEQASSPRWYRAGPDAPLEIWYGSAGSLWSVTMTPGTEPEFGKPEHLTEDRPELRGFDILSDGRILHRIAGDDEKDPGRLEVILNWKASITEKLN